MRRNALAYGLSLALAGCASLAQIAATSSNERLCYMEGAGPESRAAAVRELAARGYTCRPGDAQRGRSEYQRELAEGVDDLGRGMTEAGATVRCQSYTRGGVTETVCR